MLWTFVFLLLIMVGAGLVVLYVAYPHRGEEMPYLPQVGEKMWEVREAISTLESDDVRR